MKKTLQRIIREAGALALDYFSELGALEVKKKSPRDLVTEADVQVELFLKEKLLSAFPETGFLGEESGQTSHTKSRWVVDPIDGTHSFVRGQYFWSISIALEVDQQIQLGAVYAPRLDDLFVVEKGKGATKNDQPIHVSNISSLSESMVGTGFACLRDHLEENNLPRFNRIATHTMGQRRYGSVALDLCLVAEGQLDAFWEQQLNYYDVAAGSLIATEAGASLTNFKGVAGLYPKEILVTNQHLLEEILRLM